MFQIIKSHKILAGGAIVAILAVGWFIIGGGGSQQAAPLLGSSALSASVTGNATVAGVDHELQNTLDKVRAIQLNNQVLNDPVFASLSDIGQQIVPEPFGRANPFAPISGSVQPAAQPSVSSTKK
jgi:hypothetical protein